MLSSASDTLRSARADEMDKYARIENAEAAIASLGQEVSGFLAQHVARAGMRRETQDDSLSIGVRVSNFECKLDNFVLTLREEMRLLRGRLEQEIATLEIRLAVTEELSHRAALPVAEERRDAETPILVSLGDEVFQEAAPGLETSGSNFMDLHQRILAIENANMLERLENLECSRVEEHAKLQQRGGGIGPSQNKSSSTLEEERMKTSRSGSLDYVCADSHALKESMWDVAVFAGVKNIGGPASCWVVFILAINIFFQATLCCLIHDTFTSKTVDSDLLEGLRLWRTSTAHEFKWMNELTHTTLGQRICEGDSVVPISSSVANLLGTIDGYLREDGPRAANTIFGQYWVFFTHDVGILMSCLVVTLWWLETFHEIHDTVNLALAMYSIPVGMKTELVEDSNSSTLETLSRARKYYVYFIILMKLSIAVLLLVTGTCYLIFTISMRDLLLNAAALAVVFNIDDLIFASLAPRLAKKLIQNIAPISRPAELFICGLDAGVLLKVLILAIGLFTILIVHLRPQNEELKKARHEICGGFVDFVSLTDPYGAVVAAEVPTSATTFEGTYRYKAMRQLVTKKGAIKERMSTRNQAYSLSATALGIFGSSYSIQSQSRLPVAQVLDYWVTDCSDMPSAQDCASEEQCWRLWVLHEATRDSTIQSCADVVNFCGLDALGGIRARQYCPHTCGCDDPTAANMFFSPAQGCGSFCRKTPTYSNVMDIWECMDEDTNSAAFARYRQAVEKTQLSYIDSAWRGIAGPVKDVLASSGCGPAIRAIDAGGYTVDMCDDFNVLGWKPLTLLCPLTCGCAVFEMQSEMCPHKCFQINSSIQG